MLLVRFVANLFTIQRATLPTRSANMSSELTEEYLKDESFDENYVNQNYVEIPDWHMAIIEERLARYESEDKTNWSTWEEFEKELLAEFEIDKD